MKTLVTGTGGFIASHLVEKLVEQGHEAHFIRLNAVLLAFYTPCGLRSAKYGQIKNLVHE